MEKVKPVCRQCGSEMRPVGGMGRPPRYCSQACRRLIEFALRRADRALATAEREAIWWQHVAERKGGGGYRPDYAWQRVEEYRADVERLTVEMAALVARTQGEEDG